MLIGGGWMKAPAGSKAPHPPGSQPAGPPGLPQQRSSSGHFLPTVNIVHANGPASTLPGNPISPTSSAVGPAGQARVFFGPGPSADAADAGIATSPQHHPQQQHQQQQLQYLSLPHEQQAPSQRTASGSALFASRTMSSPMIVMTGPVPPTPPVLPLTGAGSTSSNTNHPHPHPLPLPLPVPAPLTSHPHGYIHPAHAHVHHQNHHHHPHSRASLSHQQHQQQQQQELPSLHPNPLPTSPHILANTGLLPTSPPLLASVSASSSASSSSSFTPVSLAASSSLSFGRQALPTTVTSATAASSSPPSHTASSLATPMPLPVPMSAPVVSSPVSPASAYAGEGGGGGGPRPQTLIGGQTGASSSSPAVAPTSPTQTTVSASPNAPSTSTSLPSPSSPSPAQTQAHHPPVAAFSISKVTRHGLREPRRFLLDSFNSLALVVPEAHEQQFRTILDTIADERSKIHVISMTQAAMAASAAATVAATKASKSKVVKVATTPQTQTSFSPSERDDPDHNQGVDDEDDDDGDGGDDDDHGDDDNDQDNVDIDEDGAAGAKLGNTTPTRSGRKNNNADKQGLVRASSETPNANKDQQLQQQQQQRDQQHEQQQNPPRRRRRATQDSLTTPLRTLSPPAATTTVTADPEVTPMMMGTIAPTPLSPQMKGRTASVRSLVGLAASTAGAGATGSSSGRVRSDSSATDLTMSRTPTDTASADGERYQNIPVIGSGEADRLMESLTMACHQLSILAESTRSDVLDLDSLYQMERLPDYAQARLAMTFHSEPVWVDVPVPAPVDVSQHQDPTTLQKHHSQQSQQKPEPDSYDADSTSPQANTGAVNLDDTIGEGSHDQVADLELLANFPTPAKNRDYQTTHSSAPFHAGSLHIRDATNGAALERAGSEHSDTRNTRLPSLADMPVTPIVSAANAIVIDGVNNLPLTKLDDNQHFGQQQHQLQQQHQPQQQAVMIVRQLVSYPRVLDVAFRPEHKGASAAAAREACCAFVRSCRPSVAILSNLLERAPQWMPDNTSSHCTRCTEPFTMFTRRKHHCRSCGSLVCGSCSEKEAVIPDLGYHKPVRVCDSCFELIGHYRMGNAHAAISSTLANAASNAQSVTQQNSLTSPSSPDGAVGTPGSNGSLPSGRNHEARSMSPISHEINRQGQTPQTSTRHAPTSSAFAPFSPASSALSSNDDICVRDTKDAASSSPTTELTATDGQKQHIAYSQTPTSRNGQSAERDVYGFPRSQSKQSEAAHARILERIKRRTDEWISFLCLHPIVDHRSMEVKQLVRRGIPPRLRGYLWQVLLENKTLRLHFDRIALSSTEALVPTPTSTSPLAKFIKVNSSSVAAALKDLANADAKIAASQGSSGSPSRRASSPSIGSGGKGTNSTCAAVAAFLHSLAFLNPYDHFTAKEPSTNLDGSFSFNFNPAHADAGMESLGITPGSHYARLLGRALVEASPSAVNDIEKDIRRTFPDNQKYETQLGLNMLRRVLVAYTVHNPAVGYCQSMNFISALLLLFIEREEDAFWALVCIVELVVHIQVVNPEYKLLQRSQSNSQGGITLLTAAEPVPLNPVHDKYVTRVAASGMTMKITPPNLSTSNGDASTAGKNPDEIVSLSRSPSSAEESKNCVAESTKTTFNNAGENSTTVDHSSSSTLGVPHFVSVIYHQRDLRGAQIDAATFALLLAEREPRVHYKLMKAGIVIETIVINWFLCLFVDSLPIEVMLLVWDCLFLEGTKVLFRAGLALLRHLRSDIEKANSSAEILTLLGGPHLASLDIDPFQFSNAMYYPLGVAAFPTSRLKELRERAAEKLYEEERDAQVKHHKRKQGLQLKRLSASADPSPKPKDRDSASSAATAPLHSASSTSATAPIAAATTTTTSASTTVSSSTAQVVSLDVRKTSASHSRPSHGSEESVSKASDWARQLLQHEASEGLDTDIASMMLGSGSGLPSLASIPRRVGRRGSVSSLKESVQPPAKEVKSEEKGATRFGPVSIDSQEHTLAAKSLSANGQHMSPHEMTLMGIINPVNDYFGDSNERS